MSLDDNKSLKCKGKITKPKRKENTNGEKLPISSANL